MGYQNYIKNIQKKYKFILIQKINLYSYLKSRSTFLKRNFKKRFIKTKKKSISSTFKVLIKINRSNLNQYINKNDN